MAALKKSFPRQGFVDEIAALEGEAKAFASEFSSKGAATPSQAWKLLHSAKPESVLWVAHTSKNAGIQGKFKGFFTEWAQARQKIPYVLMQEMRIVPDLPIYNELLDKLFFELMDNKLGTVEEMKAYLEPYSPPAPPPPVHLRRPAHGQEGCQASQEPQEGGPPPKASDRSCRRRTGRRCSDSGKGTHASQSRCSSEDRTHPPRSLPRQRKPRRSLPHP